MDRNNTTVKVGGFVSRLLTGEIYRFKQEVMQVKKPVRSIDDVPTTVTLTDIPVSFRVCVSCLDSESMELIYDA